MSLPITFRPEARAELIDAWSWYEEQRPGLGDELEACVEAAIGAAARSPSEQRRVYGEVRRVLVKRFPYGVYYIVGGLARLPFDAVELHALPGTCGRAVRDLCGEAVRSSSMALNEHSFIRS